MVTNSSYNKDCVATAATVKAMLSEPDLLAENKTSEVSFRVLLSHVLAKEYSSLTTSFAGPTAPQESPVPTCT